MTLAELVATEPLNASRTDQQVLDWCNELVADWQDVSWLDLSMWVAGADLRPALNTAVSSGTDAQKTAAQHLLDCLAAGQPLYATDARVRSTISKAVSGQVRTDLITLATTQVPRWSQAGVPAGEVTINHVAEARA